MKSIGLATLSTMVFLFMPSLTQANSPKWNASIGVNVGNTHRPNYPQQPPHYHSIDQIIQVKVIQIMDIHIIRLIVHFHRQVMFILMAVLV